MEVKVSFKQSEVGVIPEDWRVTPVSDLCVMVVDCKNRTPPVVDGDQYAVVRTPNVRDGRFVRDDLRYTDAKSFGVWTARAVPQIGDVLITREAPLGEVCLVPSDVKVCLGQRMMMYRPDTGKTSSSYLLYALTSTGVQSNLLRKIGGSTVGHAKVDDIRFLQVPLPQTINEQDAIAEVLSDMDTLIESLERILAKKRQIKQGAMQELLTGSKRLPELAGRWTDRELQDVADIRSGGTPNTSQPEFWDGDVLWCTPTDITALKGRKYLRDSERKITQAGVQNSSAEIIPARSIVMTSRATIGECAINLFPVTTNQGFKNLVPHEDVDVEFLYYLLQTQKQALVRLSGGSTFLEIGKAQLARFSLRMPTDRQEQVAIAAVLTDMDRELAMEEEKLTKARVMKQGMMQELLTGRIRLV